MNWSGGEGGLRKKSFKDERMFGCLCSKLGWGTQKGERENQNRFWPGYSLSDIQVEMSDSHSGGPLVR